MYQKTVLANGTRVVTEHIPHVRSVSLGIWFETGSRDESWHEQGFSHMIEHLSFKGTKRHSARQLAELMDASGGHLNAFTAKEHTCYYARVLDEKFSLAADVLKDMLLDSIYDPDELEKERGVILEEIKMYEDAPDDMVHDLLCEALWPQHPLGRNILGTRETICTVKRKQLVDFWKMYYTTDRLVISAAGNVSHQQVVEEVAEGFDSLQKVAPQNRKSPSVHGGSTLHRAKDTEQLHLCIGGPGLPRGDRRKNVLNLLDAVLGGGMSSRLFQELREERGLVYSTFSYHSSFVDSGSFGVYAGFSPDQIGFVRDIILEQMENLAAAPVSEEELSRAKNQLKGGLMLSLESMTNRMTRLARSEMNYKRFLHPDEIAAALDAVTQDDIQALAAELYRPDRFAVAVVGPQTEVKEVRNLA